MLFNIGSIPEVLNEKNACLFDPENKEDFMNKLRYIRKYSAQDIIKAKQAY